MCSIRSVNMAKLLFFAFTILLTCGSTIGQDGPIPADNSTTTPAPAPTQPPSPPNTTVIPDTTAAPTTAAPETTVAPETTAAPTEPPTSPPDTTTAAPTTPAPEMSYNYNVTSNNITCIMIEGSLSFSINYTVGTNETKVATVSLPKHPKQGYSVDGTCNGTRGEQSITVTWGLANQSSNVALVFNATGETWSVISFTASLYMDPLVFVNATEAGKTLMLEVDYGFSPLGVPVNHSFNCHSALSTVNITGTIGDESYNLPISSKLDGIHIQAYNKIPNEPDFVSSVHCSADETSDVVPIAVGCALAGLVVIVLIAYLVGRRRRSAAYQSV